MTTNEPEKKRAHPKVAFLLRSFLKSSLNSPFCWGAKKRKKQKREREKRILLSLSLFFWNGEGTEKKKKKREERKRRRRKRKRKSGVYIIFRDER